MKLQFLGSGSAFVPISENYQSNMVLESASGKRLLIDCGTDARHAMEAIGLSYKDVDAVYISHFHADHVGGLEWLAFRSHFDPDVKRPKLFIHPSMLTNLWNKVLRGGLESLKEQKASLGLYFDVPTIKDALHFSWESIDFEMVQTIHVYNGSDLVPSFGLFIREAKNRIFITSDTQFNSQDFNTYYQEATFIFQDCEIDKYPSGVHAHFLDLMTLAPEIKAKMFLYHYSEEPLPDAKAAGFRGFVRRGQVFDFE